MPLFYWSPDYAFGSLIQTGPLLSLTSIAASAYFTCLAALVNLAETLSQIHRGLTSFNQARLIPGIDQPKEFSCLFTNKVNNFAVKLLATLYTEGRRLTEEVAVEKEEGTAAGIQAKQKSPTGRICKSQVQPEVEGAECRAAWPSVILCIPRPKEGGTSALDRARTTTPPATAAKRCREVLIEFSRLRPRVAQDPCSVLQPDECWSCKAISIILGRKPNVLAPLSHTNMPATTVEEWLQSERADEPPHRCKKIVREWATDDGAFVTCCADDGTQQTHRLVAMSSLSRRACYKCGNVGH